METRRTHALPTLLACSLAVVALGVAGCEDDDDGSGSQGPGPSADFLTVVQAAGGTLAKGPNGLELTLTGVAPQVVAFTDRPQRGTGALSSSRFFGTWAQEYGDDPPNAALAILNGKPEADTVVLTLDPPRTDGSSVRFTAQPLSSTPAGLEQFREQTDPAVPTQFGEASLFVDAGGLMQLVAYGAQDVYLTGGGG